RRWVAAVDDMGGAQVGLLSGKADAGAARDAQRLARDATDELRAVAAALLERYGHKPDPAILQRTARTFRGAAMDREARATLLGGCLTAEYDEPGFDALLAAGAVPTTGAAKRSGAPPLAVVGQARRDVEDAAAIERRRQVAELRERLQAARAERKAAHAAAARAARAAEHAQRTADDAAARARKARTVADDAARAVERADEKIAALERGLR